MAASGEGPDQFREVGLIHVVVQNDDLGNVCSLTIGETGCLPAVRSTTVIRKKSFSVSCVTGETMDFQTESRS